MGSTSLSASLDPVDTQVKTFDIDRLESQRDSDKLHKMANEFIDALQSSHGKVDFSRDDKMRKNIDTLFADNPRNFKNKKTFSWETQDDKDLLIAALRAQFALQTPLDDIELTFDPEPQEIERVFETQAPLFDAQTIEHIENQNAKRNAPPSTHIGLEFIHLQMHVHDITEKRIHALIDKLSHLNSVNKDLADLINALSSCKEKGKADFSDDDEMKAIIDRLFKENPKIFENTKTYVWDSEKKIDFLLTMLDAEVKAKVAEVNQATMFINVRFDERVQFSENARKILEMLIRHIESIISKYSKA